jgi:hypothetical protein
MSTDQFTAKIYMACLRAIREMGPEEFKKASWFSWKKHKIAASDEMKKAA